MKKSLMKKMGLVCRDRNVLAYKLLLQLRDSDPEYFEKHIENTDLFKEIFEKDQIINGLWSVINE